MSNLFSSLLLLTFCLSVCLCAASSPADGFMMQYGSEGQWGRGLYFAREPGYCDVGNYVSSARQTPNGPGRPPLAPDEREILQASLLLGCGTDGKRLLLGRFYTKVRSLCQDRLGTDVGRVEQKMCFLQAYARAGQRSGTKTAFLPLLC
jgi:hypothetical protein